MWMPDTPREEAEEDHSYSWSSPLWSHRRTEGNTGSRCGRRSCTLCCSCSRETNYSKWEIIISQIEPAGRLTGLGIRGRGGSYDVVLGERTETLGEVIAGLGRGQADGGEEEYEKVERSHGGHSEAGDFSSIYNLKSEISSSSSSCHCTSRTRFYNEIF